MLREARRRAEEGVVTDVERCEARHQKPLMAAMVGVSEYWVWCVLPADHEGPHSDDERRLSEG